ncbi:MAG TPA: helix-hairpin-helix domain-containing protein [Thermomicrobiales bacterium]|nr:helix-hairpin-helix domain-containing protein [Thermomicrobiales bacterium]
MITNSQIADQLRAYADLLEMTGESGFRLNAYRRAAESIQQHERPVATEPHVRSIPSVGAGIAAILNEIVTTGSFAALDELQEQMPGSVLALLDVPGVGLKTAARLYLELGITSLAGLEDAIRDGRLGTMKGMGPKAQSRIAEGLLFLQRRSGRSSIGAALPLAQRLAAELAARVGVPVHVVGSVRRMCETTGNIDLLAIADDAGGVLGAAGSLASVAGTIEREPDWASFELQQGISLRVAVAPAARAGMALVRWTGSSAHLAALGGVDALPEAATEEEVYAGLAMDWVPPELREDRGEVAAARERRLPRLIELGDLRGDLHLHTTWSDGSASPMEMAVAAAARGYEYLAITDHSGGLGVAGGLRPERLREQITAIRALDGNAPVRLFTGSEVEVHRDGRLDFDDALLADLDLVVASLHSGLRQPGEEFTARMLRTIANRHVDIIAHPTGRLVERRQGADIDWPQVFAAARETFTALEINADPARLDMTDIVARAAAETGVLITINSDAHHPDGLAGVRYGVGIARRAWIEPRQVVNTWPLDEVMAWLRDRRLPDGLR